ncbi:MAG: HAMP domain-containing histidine kinase [Lachnospira sp.]|nr:HAMP domain-containing histidine kinase [Lachnospira sp.]
MLYIKEDTLAGIFCRWVKKSFDKLSEIDLSDNMDKTIMKYVLVNVAVIIVLVCLWGFGIVLAIIYGFVLFFYIKAKAQKCQKDYNVMLTASHELAEGKFDTEISEDVGIFNGLKDEFKNIRSGFQKAVNEEIKSQNMKTELISNVSHDLKTPLTGIKNYVELLQDENVDEETRKKYLNTLNNYTDRLSTLIEDLFEVSKVNSGNIRLNPIELNIVALVKQAEAETEELLNERGLTVIVNSRENDIKLMLDGDKTYRIFENLFTNIGKYALSNTRVYVDIAEEAQYVEITFKNISETQMNFTPEEIVERFVRGDKSRHEKGSGLGLAIVKSFTEVQDGEFHIEVDGDLFKAVVRFPKKFS